MSVDPPAHEPTPHEPAPHRPGTVAVHAGRPDRTPDAPLNTPITLAATYVALGDVEYGPIMTASKALPPEPTSRVVTCRSLPSSRIVYFTLIPVLAVKSEGVNLAMSCICPLATIATLIVLRCESGSTSSGQTKSRHTLTIVKIDTTPRIGRDTGSTTDHRIRAGEAPSTSAAWSSSVGIESKNRFSRKMLKAFAAAGSQIAHGAIRAYAMGDRGARNEPATPDDIAAMARIVQEGIEAGALGFSTSRTIGHRAIDGEPVPGEQSLSGVVTFERMSSTTRMTVVTQFPDTELMEQMVGGMEEGMRLAIGQIEPLLEPVPAA